MFANISHIANISQQCQHKSTSTTFSHIVNSFHFANTFQHCPKKSTNANISLYRWHSSTLQAFFYIANIFPHCQHFSTSPPFFNICNIPPHCQHFLHDQHIFNIASSFQHYQYFWGLPPFLTVYLNFSTVPTFHKKFILATFPANCQHCCMWPTFSHIANIFKNFRCRAGRGLPSLIALF